MIKFTLGVLVGVYFSDEIIDHVGRPLAQKYFEWRFDYNEKQNRQPPAH
jgi:hypothetical protein